MMLNRRAAVDSLEPLQDRPEEGFVARGVAQVVDREHDDRLDTLLADPLRRREPRHVEADVIWIADSSR